MTHPSPLSSAERRRRLASQISQATIDGNERELAGLQSLWVHRYGVDSLPVVAEQPPSGSMQAGDNRFARFTTLIKDALTEVSAGVDDFPSGNGAPIGSRIDGRDVAAPPSSTPLSLRRWLVRDRDDIPKAS